VSNFQVNANWDVVVDGQVVGDLDSADFGGICPGGPLTAPGPDRVDGMPRRRQAPSSRPTGARRPSSRPATRPA
jgi:hypothetical protein